MDVTVKISVLSTDAKTIVDDKNYQFHVRADEQKIKMQIKAKTWRKLVKGNNEYPSWAGLSLYIEKNSL